MKDLNIDLGSTGPSYPEAALPPKSEERKYYPCFYYSGDESLGLPGKEGTMVIKYREKSKTERQDADGDESYSCEIEVLEIVSAEADEPSKSESKKSEDALDNLLKEKRSAKKSDDDEDY